MKDYPEDQHLLSRKAAKAKKEAAAKQAAAKPKVLKPEEVKKYLIVSRRICIGKKILPAFSQYNIYIQVYS